MSRFVSLLVLLFTVLSGCAGTPITGKEFALVWDEFLRREFEESFDEKQSISQREKLIREICTRYSVRFNDIRTYMMKNHPDRYGKIFLNQ